MRISDWSSDVCSSDLLDGDPDAAIRSQDEDAYLRIGDDFGEQWTSGTPALVEIVHDSTRQDSAIPVRRIENALQRYGQQVGALRLLARGINPAVAAPLSVAHKDLSTPEARRGMLMAILPYFLIKSEEHTSELQSLMRISYAVFCLKKK